MAATARMTLGSILGTATDAAQSVSAVFNTATKAINMGNKFVSDAAEKQSIRSTLDMHDFTMKLAEEKAMEETLRKKTILDFTKQSTENEQLFETAYNRINQLLEDRVKKAATQSVD